MKPLHRFLTTMLRWIAYGLASVIVIILVAVIILGFTPPGARLVAHLIETQASTPDQIITISDPSALLTGRLTVSMLTLNDSKGMYAQISDLSVDWSPLSLLSATFDATTVSAGAVRIERLPIPSTETQEVRSAFALPVNVRIATLALPQVILGKALAGAEQFLALDGTIDATNESMAVTVSATQSERPDARASADIVYNPAANALKIEAVIDEPKGGVLAKLLRLPNEPAVNISIAGQGALSAWTGTATAALDGAQILKLDGQHDLSQDGLHNIVLTGGGAFGSLMPPALRPMFAGTTTIDLAAAFDEAGMIRIDSGTLATGALNLSASGTVNTTGDNDLKARLTGKDGPIDFRLPLEGGEARVLINDANLSLIGTGTSAILDTGADIVEATFPQGRIEAVRLAAYSDAFNFATQSGTLQATIETGATSFVNPDIDRLIRGPVKIAGTLGVTPQTLRFDPLTIESASIGGTLTGTADLANSSVTTAFSLFALPSVLPDALAAKFDTTIALGGTVAASADGAVNITDLVVKSGTIEAAGNASLADDALTAALTGSLPALGKLLADATGSAAFEADISGPLSELAVKAEVTSTGATLAGRTLSDLSVAADATLSAQAPRATLTATGALDGQAIDVSAELISQNGTTSVPAIEARVGDNRLTGSLTLTPDFKPNGRFDFTLPDIGLLAAMAGQTASGDLAGSATISTVNQTTSATLKASGSGIRRGDLVIASPAIDLAISDLTALAIKGGVRAEAIAQGENRVAGLSLDFEQQGPVTGVTLDATYDGAPLLARGDIRTVDGRTDIALATFSGAPRQIAVRLASPTVISIADGQVSLQALTIAAGSGTVAVSGRAGERLDLAVRLSNLPANLVNSLTPALGAEGIISGTAKIGGTPTAPDVAYDLTWGNASVAQVRSAGLGALDIAANGRFVNNQVTLATSVSGAGGLNATGGGTLGTGSGLPIAMQFSGNAPFALAAGILAAQGFELTGNAAVDVALSGAATAPRISGTISTAGGRLVDVRRNLAVNDLTGSVRLDGESATITNLTGNLSSGGSVAVRGSIGIALGSGYPADLAIALNNATYVDGSLFTASLEGALTLTGPLTGTPTIGGQVTIEKAAITIPEKLPASLSEINITHKNAPAAVTEITRDVKADSGGGGGAGGGGVAFDLAVNAPGQMFVRGRGIDAELGGNLTIQGTAAAPSVSGAFQLRRGRLEILGKRLDFADGTIGFGGGLVPTLDLDATSTAGSATITVNVAGQANNPTVTFTSSPALPQDEILAQLIFNRSLSNLSALQIAQLASAVSQLAGGGSTSLLDNLRSKLGVDDLDVSTDDEGGAQVTAGKYLNDRTYIELQQGGDTGGTKATINLDIGRGVKLRGDVGSEGGGAGIFYEKEY